MTDLIVPVPDFKAVGAAGDLCRTLPMAMALSSRFHLPVIMDRGEQKAWGARDRFTWSYDFEGGRILWIRE